MYSLSRHNRDRRLQLLATARSAKDIVYWFDEWVWTYDPRLTVPSIPMILFQKQRDLLHWLEEREVAQEDALAEKSRDMGFTWLCAGFLVHHWLFKPGFKGSIGSRKEALVDKIGDPDSIFEKMRMLLQHLPGWMLPAGFSWKEHDNFCKLVNPANGATITGEAGDNIGRGGRSSVYIVDEAAFIERAEKVEAALSANTNCRVYISTPNGTGNAFYRKRISGDIPVFTMHWKDDPRKNFWEIKDPSGAIVDSGAGGSQPPNDIPNGCKLIYPWYEREKKRLQDPVVIAQELDIDYTASLEGVVIPAKWVQAAVNLDKRIRMPESKSVIASLDVADGGKNLNVLTLRRGCVVTEIHTRQEGGTTDTANWALDKALEAGARTLNYDVVGVGAGIAGTYLARSREKDLGLTANGINVGEQPTNVRWPDGKTSQEKFVNLKAEAWFTVRRRFEKTYEYVEDGVNYPVDELISIPDNPTLIQQLSNVLYYATETGKIQIEKKDQLKRRGVGSPDHAESLILSFIPETRQPEPYSRAGRARSR